MQGNSVLITGIGLVSSMGEGIEAHWQAVTAPLAPNLDKTGFAPYIVHRLGAVDWNLQIPRRSDQRQMEIWQRLGTYAAGLALEDAGLKAREDLTAKMDMIIAAGGGERDIAVDTQILAQARLCRTEEERGRLLNRILLTELRPTLFLAQLSNLLAGNISIVHKVTGSSRSFMGEEGSGLAAMETAFARIRSGQSSHILVGASYNAEHYDMLLGQELNSYLKADGYAPVWSRHRGDERAQAAGGLITGTAGAFLVLESAAHAETRGARVYAEIDIIATGQTNRQKTSLAETLSAMIKTAIAEKKADFAVSAASGVYGVTQQEEKALQQAGLVYRAFSTLFGHMREAQFPFAVALAALAVHKGRAFAPLEKKEPAQMPELESALAIIAGIDRAEGLACLSKV
ncbi:beta-ketoacyl-ACP synthase [Candidatus Tokpelaia sp.]|uniref:beta-ketoacyl-ACP synthase n=1 Tax=Candidatus Tokpelaia sp. TaxID=2233777 RepID=UPI001238C974|nr:beta-ketoacyl-ACP synthase [Candidatus Tokpelaia sp.]KAA6404760.1 beta-ketoacyl-ACP synthase [Candidatus Tokpelaia sp.]